MRSPVAIAERILCLAALPALGLGIYYSARVAAADALYRRNTPQALAQAVRADSGNAEYHQLYAEHLESSGLDPSHERETAALLSPLESRYWIDLGTLAEVRGDAAAAELYYLKAESVDRKFAPRWALMNFYLRRQQEKAFWEWTQKAMDRAYGDASQIFRLCWLMSSDAESIRKRIPPTAYLQSEYLRFLIEDQHMDAAEKLAGERAEKVAGAESPEFDRLLRYCDLTRGTRTASSLAVWNTLARRKLTPFQELDPRVGRIVTDEELRTAPIGHGFDWELPQAEGVSVTLESPSGLRIELTGEQAESVVILKQWMPVEKGRRYRIEYTYASVRDSLTDARMPSGVAFEIAGPVVDSPVSGAALRNDSGGETGVLEFTAAGSDSSVMAVELSLRYRRTPGTVRRPEKFTIERVISRPGS